MMILPKDILKYAVRMNGQEAERNIALTAQTYVTSRRVDYSDPIGRFGLQAPINVANGDTIEFTWTWHNPINDERYVAPQKMIFYSTSIGSVYTQRIE